MTTHIKHIIQYSSKALLLAAILVAGQAKAQIPANAVNADPAVVSVTQIPNSSSIIGNAVLQFRFANPSGTSNTTGQIPANSVRLTISFPGQYAYSSVNSIPKFVVEDADTEPFGDVHLVNNQLILEGEQIDLLLNVRGVQLGTGTVTFNADRITPITVANTTTVNDNTQATFTTSTTLPVVLGGFSARGEGCTARIAWTTTAELNLDRFEIMKSTDAGNTFTTVQTVAASGNQAGKTYNYTDQMQGTKPHLYRLKMIDKDGSITYSSITRINSGCKGDGNYISIYPSPARSSVTLNVSDERYTGTRASMLDINGRVVKTFIITGTAVPLTVSDLPAGTYLIRLEDNSTVKFVKK